MNLKPSYRATTKGGFKVIGATGQAWANEIKRMFPEQDITITVTKRRKTRSSQQNRYYHGVVIPLVQDSINETGLRLSRAQVHDFLKKEFLPPIEIISNKTGEVKQVPGSTTTQSTSEMMDFFSLIQQWAAEFLGVVIPDPNEQLAIFK